MPLQDEATPVPAARQQLWAKGTQIALNLLMWTLLPVGAGSAVSLCT